MVNDIAMKMVLSHLQCRGVLVALLVCLCIATGCANSSDESRGLRKLVSLPEFLNDPEQTVGSLLTVRGNIDRGGDVYRISDFDERFQQDYDPSFRGVETRGVFVAIGDEAFSRYLSGHGEDGGQHCLGVPVELSGEVGAIERQDQFGIVKVESLFLLDSENLDTGRGKLCYSIISGR